MHDAVEFLVCVFSYWTIKTVMADKGLNLFDECAVECVHLCSQEDECK